MTKRRWACFWAVQTYCRLVWLSLRHAICLTEVRISRKTKRNFLNLSCVWYGFCSARYGCKFERIWKFSSFKLGLVGKLKFNEAYLAALKSVKFNATKTYERALNSGLNKFKFDRIAELGFKEWTKFEQAWGVIALTNGLNLTNQRLNLHSKSLKFSRLYLRNLKNQPLVVLFY